MSHSLLESFIKRGAKLEEIKRYFETNTDTSILEITKEYLIITNKNKYVLIKEHINGFQTPTLLTQAQVNNWRNSITLNDVLYEMECKGQISFKLKSNQK
jgi:hypothetical protein